MKLKTAKQIVNEYSRGYTQDQKTTLACRMVENDSSLWHETNKLYNEENEIKKPCQCRGCKR